MNDPRLQVVKWPDVLSHALDRLERTMHQEFTEMKLDDGNVSRRPKTSPFPIFKGTAVLNEAEKAALDRFCETGLGRHFSFSSPHTGTTVYATFIQAPFVRSTHIVVGTRTTYEVEFIFRETTDLIKRAFEHGVVTSAEHAFGRVVSAADQAAHRYSALRELS